MTAVDASFQSALMETWHLGERANFCILVAMTVHLFQHNVNNAAFITMNACIDVQP